MGSDYLQMNNRRDKVPFIKAIQSCQRLIVANPVLFTRISAENIINNDALRSVYFGLEPLELLDSMTHIGAAESKKHFGISPDTLVITCGYNASPNQQHIEIINALTNARSIPERHLVVVPLTYGGNTGYKQEVREILSKSGLNYRTIDTFLPDSDIAMWRKASDIFIQVQKTDALSGSMQESLFCDNIVITGAWLPYEVLKEKGIAFFEVNNVKEITTKLDFIISNYPQIREEIRSANTPEKFTHAFWKNCIAGWHDVLMEYRQSKNSINAN
jgi:glycosyltransferase involved in cell wall biosynthesis